MDRNGFFWSKTYLKFADQEWATQPDGPQFYGVFLKSECTPPKFLDPPPERYAACQVYHFHRYFIITTFQEQDCIPVGCVPPACCWYLRSARGGYLLRGGVPTLGAGVPASGPGGGYLPLVRGEGWCILAWNGADPPLWPEWQTRVKT